MSSASRQGWNRGNDGADSYTEFPLIVFASAPKRVAAMAASETLSRPELYYLPSNLCNQ
jgi:hypothetical protein